MRAVWLRETGGPEVLVPGEALDPLAGPGQALINVELASITFVETQLRAGTAPFSLELPAIPGNGVGGVVVAVGSGVQEELLGRRVVSTLGGSGGYAELAVADASAVIEVPAGVELATAVALLADGRTAMSLVRAAPPRRGERVLVEAAAGGVGSLLVQLSGSAGAVVIAAAGGERKLELARSLGAGHAVDYTEPGWPERAGEVDLVFDGVGGEVAGTAFELLVRGGRMVSFGLASGRWAEVSQDDATAREIELVSPGRPSPEEQRELTESALAEAAAGHLRPVIGQRFPLAKAAEAHAAIESRSTLGKTLLEVA